MNKGWINPEVTWWIGIVSGFLGGVMVFISAFLDWIDASPMEELGSLFDSDIGISSGGGPTSLLLVVGIAILISTGLAWWWKNLWVGPIFLTVLAGIVLFLSLGFGMPSFDEIGISSSTPGYYLGFIGSLLALLSGLTLLSIRKIVEQRHQEGTAAQEETTASVFPATGVRQDTIPGEMPPQPQQ